MKFLSWNALCPLMPNLRKLQHVAKIGEDRRSVGSLLPREVVLDAHRHLPLLSPPARPAGSGA